MKNKSAIDQMVEWLEQNILLTQSRDWKDAWGMAYGKARSLLAEERAPEASQAEKDKGLLDLTAIKNDVHQLTRDIAHNTTMDNEDILSRINKIFSRHEKGAK